ncbi:RusA family crossover junction endodeoxyribonuclease [Caballeronia sp. LZ035]|uniref:RusA family crossover junction endodeoxyribonuclease n=1 Tax=Caballeronia sp. LZ035 TaxID=3038568 RepID=UPI00285CE994|nr:RusA family crossover junction endodeoxyribonuclease [Caballeronia sp. LZ035]MDR5757884.1 RusA family crossover junction endodeoxyribonuclease [Caballeronia sp. LZ035]
MARATLPVPKPPADMLPLSQPVTLTLPYPVSSNRYWRTYVVAGHAQTVVSAEAKAYRREVAWLLKVAKIREPVFGRVALTVVLHPKMPQDAVQRMRKFGDRWEDDVSCIDLDNALKILIDSLKGRVFLDDRFVWKIDAQRGEPKAEAHVVVTIAHVPYHEPQQALFETMPQQVSGLIDDPFES